MSLRELGIRCGVAPSLLSSIERGKIPTLQTLSKIADALQIAITDLFKKRTYPQIVIVSAEKPSKRSGRVVEEQPGNCYWPLFNHPLEGSVQVFLNECRTKKFIRFDPHPSQVMFYILSGCCEVKLGDAVYEICAGSAAYYDAEHQPQYRTTTDKFLALVVTIPKDKKHTDGA